MIPLLAVIRVALRGAKFEVNHRNSLVFLNIL
jgi:hypothetical protein